MGFRKTCPCCEGACIGCCFPVTQDGAMGDLEWEINAPNCPDLDGQTGVLQSIHPQAIAAPDGQCGKCSYYPTSTNEPTIIGQFETDLGDTDCFVSPCSFEMIFALCCGEGEELIAGLEECCSRIRLLILLSTSGEPAPVITGVPETDVCTTNASGASIVAPVSCVCDVDCGMSAVFDLSAVGFGCSSTSDAGNSCNPCCLPTNCDLTDATLSIASTLCSSAI